MSERRNKLTEVILLCVRSVDNCSSPMKTTKKPNKKQKRSIIIIFKNISTKNKIFLKMMIKLFSVKR